MPTPARIRPGTRAEIGIVNTAIARAIGAGMGTREPPRLFTTLARHRRLYRPWLRFAARLMPFGTLPRRDSELVILRVAYLCGCRYETVHHERLGRRAGLSADEVERATSDDAPGPWSPRQAALLRATHELHETRDLSDECWAELCSHLGEHERIELPMLVGHYQMLAMTLNGLRVAPDELRGR